MPNFAIHTKIIVSQTRTYYDYNSSLSSCRLITSVFRFLPRFMVVNKLKISVLLIPFMRNFF